MTTENDQQSAPKDNALFVGLGASAGGLQALKAFFKSLPEDPGMTFIVIVHLSPDHESNLAKLLQEETSLTVQQVKEKVAMKENHVYVIPPDKLLKVTDGHLDISEPEKHHNLASIDFLFRSLGKVKGRNSAGVILSGSGNDGTMGIKTIKEHSGLVVVQEPKEATYTAMPWSAIDSGVADFVLPVQEITGELINYKKSLSEIKIPEVKEGEEKLLQKIFTRVRSKTGHDFSNYKRNSVLRRIERRMQVNQVGKLAEYHARLQEDPDEIDKLFKDLLISVTNFFRDEKAFRTLQNEIIPRLFEGKEPGDQIRVWVPGCATGEEAYSIAILLQEYAHRQEGGPQEMQIFASDIDETALNIARQGSYPDSITADVSSERLGRFFNHTGTRYEVKEQLKKMVLFAPHNLLSDPPFSKLDLVACRNLLIYLNRDLQGEVFNLFHYALRPQGHLFLGLSDSNLEASELFKPLNKKMRIYRRTPSSESHLRIPQTHLQSAGQKPNIPYYTQQLTQKRANYGALHNNLLARVYAPQSVIINENYKVIHATDNINKFLEYAGGEPSHDILQMVKSEIRQVLQSLLYSAEKNPDKHQKNQTRLQTEEGLQPVEIIVHRISDNNFSEGLLHVIFKEVSNPTKIRPKRDDSGKEQEQDETNQIIISRLEKELKDTKEQLQISVEEYETSNEELRASNEELQSMNEELQSTTEELVTSKEELQSVNEELKTVNNELESKVEKLNLAYDDLKNMMEATEISIIFVDRELCVQRFTTKSNEIFNLIDSDKGRPLEHVTHRLDYDSIMNDVRQVLTDLENVKKVVSNKEGDRWYIVRMRPYRTTDNGVEGVVLTFMDITALKKAEQELKQKARQENSLAELGLYALDGRPLEDVVHRAIQMCCEILQLEYCLLYELNDQGELFQLRRSTGNGFEGDCPEDISIDAAGKWDAGFAFENKDVLVVEDYSKEQRFGHPPFMEGFTLSSGVHVIVEGTKQAYGVLSAYSKERRDFSEHDINFLRVVANLVGEALDRDLAQQKLEKSNKKLKQEFKKSRQYQREILNTNIADRWQIGGFLHDNLAQKLVSIKIMLNNLDDQYTNEKPDISAQLTQVNSIIDESIEGIRDLTHDIIPIDIEKEGVAHAFRFLMQQTQKIYDVKCTLKTDDVIDEIKNRKLATNLYHVIQEAIKNATMHGDAKNIIVSITKSNGNFVLDIEDDGVGLEHPKNGKNGKGLRIMKHRMELFGGTFKIEDKSQGNNDETGTSVTCTIPHIYLTEED